MVRMDSLWGFHKKFKTNLSGRLQQLFMKCLNLCFIPPSWHQAWLVLTPKTEKDVSYLEAYRPISILNIDSMNLLKMLVKGLNSFTGEYIHYDQMGFIKCCYTKDNIQNVRNLLDWVQVEQLPLVFHIIEAIKAFDTVEWDYLKTVIQYQWWVYVSKNNYKKRGSAWVSLVPIII